MQKKLFLRSMLPLRMKLKREWLSSSSENKSLLSKRSATAAPPTHPLSLSSSTLCMLADLWLLMSGNSAATKLNLTYFAPLAKLPGRWLRLLSGSKPARSGESKSH